jgi:L-fuconolactonase
MINRTSPEPILDPDLPIVDAHHHLWFLPEARLAAMDAQESILGRALAPVCRRNAHCLFEEFMVDLRSGHNVRSTVFVDAGAMYRASGPDAMKSVGEVEFVNGVAAMAASGLFGAVKACAGLVGGIDLRLGDAVEGVLPAQFKLNSLADKSIERYPSGQDRDSHSCRAG